jgi:carbon-monoxide dehydrogenase large subunit
MLIENAAPQFGVDPAELRRRNAMPASAMPDPTPMSQVYDSGDFVKIGSGRPPPR